MSNLSLHRKDDPVQGFPSTNPKTHPDLPDELRQYPQWVVWKRVPRPDGRTDKIPVNPRTLTAASTTDPNTWSDYATAVARLGDRRVAGLGFVFTVHDPYTFVDLDHCIPEDGRIDEDAQRIVASLHSWSEISQSGTGIHVIVRATKPGDKNKAEHAGVEMYDRVRFVALTGKHLPGTPTGIEDRQAEVERLYRELWPPKWTPAEPTRSINLAAIPTDKDELLARMFDANNGAKLTDLYHGNWQHRYVSQSSADLALCNALAFWTGRNAAMIDRIFRTSGLMREKWDRKADSEGRTYGERTIKKAIDGCTRTFGDNRGGKDETGADFDQWLGRTRQWVKSTPFADFVPPDLQSAAGYRTDSTDTKVADALLDVAASKRTRRFVTNLADLRRLAGVGSRQTVANALKRLAGWFVNMGKDQDGRTTYELLAPPSRTLDIGGPPSCGYYVSNLREAPPNQTYSRGKGQDPYLTGRSRTAKNLGNELPGLGETILRLRDALETHGPSTRAQLIAVTSKSKSAVQRGTRRAEELGIFKVEEGADPWSPKVYALSPEADAIIAELLPTMTTFLLAIERAQRDEEQRQQYAERRLKRDKLDQKQRQDLTRQQGRSIGRRRQLLALLHPDWSDEEIMRWILEPGPTHRPWVDKRLAIADRIHDVKVAMADLQEQGIEQAEWTRMLLWAGYDAADVRLATS